MIPDDTGPDENLPIAETPRIRIGTAGWTISREAADAFPGEGRHLERYARTLQCAEINSSFRRSHRTQVYERWAAQTPVDFRFSVKVPSSITHEARLRGVRGPLERFLSEASGLGPKLAILLLQFPPSFVFELRPLRSFLLLLRESFSGAVVCEPRNASWFTPQVDSKLASLRVARAGADPARWPEAARPGGWLGPANDAGKGIVYYRWHGAPRTYWSRYTLAWLQDRAREVRRLPGDAGCWCIFDNTASSAAISNALEFQALLRSRREDVVRD